MEYYQYFRLKDSPFQPASPGRAVYFSPTHLEGLATLESGLSGELNGLTMLTGEAGTGKTTLIYALLQRDFKRVRIAHIDDPKLSFLEIMRLILTQLNLYSAGSTKLDYLKALDHLLELHGQEERIAIVIDESQVLSEDVLEELRLLWNRGQRNGRRLQVILVGQPELAERLKKPELRQLNQRISSRGVLKPLNSTQALMYVECLLTAQGSKCSAIFAPGALKRLLRRSDGIPRKINMLCHAAMTAAFYAGESKVSVKTARKIADEYHDSVAITHGFRTRRLVITGLVAGTALASLLLLGFVRRNVWAGWLPSYIGWLSGHTALFSGTVEQTVRPAKPGEQLSRDGHQVFVAKLEGAGAPGTHPLESGASPASGAAAPVVPKSDVAPSSAPLDAGVLDTASANPRIQRPLDSSATPPPRSHVTVRDGDTLEKIAVRYLGSKSGIEKLIEVNPSIRDINQLSVGEIIYLPAGISPNASNDQATSPPSNAQDY